MRRTPAPGTVNSANDVLDLSIWASLPSRFTASTKPGQVRHSPLHGPLQSVSTCPVHCKPLLDFRTETQTLFAPAALETERSQPFAVAIVTCFPEAIMAVSLYGPATACLAVYS